MGKIARADAVIWCDTFQFERHGFTNRNALSDGTPLLVPVAKQAHFGPINRAPVADDSRWRRKLAATLRQRLGADEYAREVERPYRLLVGLNMSLLGLLCEDLGVTADWYMASHLGAAYDDVNASERLARMTAELGGTRYLSGPSGRNYLDERPFHERGISVMYHEHYGPNHTALEPLPADVCSPVAA